MVLHADNLPDRQQILDIVTSVPDPEIPVVTIADLGIFRDLAVSESGAVVVTITPTYSGCPAMKAIEQAIVERLETAGIADVTVALTLSPAWTTDWITDEGRQKMKAYGIAPPAVASVEQSNNEQAIRQVDCVESLRASLFATPIVECPRCDSKNTRRLSAFGSTACKEHWQCNDCSEPFDHFKCH